MNYVTFPFLKIISVLKEKKHGYLIHTWSDKAFDSKLWINGGSEITSIYNPCKIYNVQVNVENEGEYLALIKAKDYHDIGKPD